MPGPRLGGELGRLLLPRHHRGRSRAHERAVRALHLSKERNEPPDIDVDFEHERREEVMQYVYAQVRPRPRRARRDASSPTGRRARCATSARRSGLDLDAGRPARRQSLAWWDGREVDAERASREARLRSRRPGGRASWSTLTGELIGFPRHLSQHVGGFVIARGPARRAWCRSRTPRWPTAPSSSGTRTTSTRSACSRSTARARHADGDPARARPGRRACAAAHVRTAGHPGRGPGDLRR